MRDDLTFLLEEELSSVCLCALHSEMRNTKQLLGSPGVLAYRCNALDECNKALSQDGPGILTQFEVQRCIKVFKFRGPLDPILKNLGVHCKIWLSS